MESIIALICLICALGLLILLSIIDLRTRLLPNVYVGAFALSGLIFHAATDFAYLPFMSMLIGGLYGFVSLFLVRMVANRFYKQDALGLGDVKLLGAGGLWLGPDYIMLAMATGAMAGLIHGLGYGFYTARATGEKVDFSRLKIPAGPGFAVGLILVALLKFQHFQL